MSELEYWIERELVLSEERAKIRAAHRRMASATLLLNVLAIVAMVAFVAAAIWFATTGERRIEESKARGRAAVQAEIDRLGERAWIDNYLAEAGHER